MKKKKNNGGIPAKVRIAGFDWKIETTDNDATIDGSLGVCRRTLKSIVVVDHPAMPRDEVKDTLVHELLHALVHTFNLFPEDDEEAEEKVVRPLATALVGMLNDNPDLLKYLGSK